MVFGHCFNICPHWGSRFPAVLKKFLAVSFVLVVGLIRFTSRVHVYWWRQSINVYMCGCVHVCVPVRVSACVWPSIQASWCCCNIFGYTRLTCFTEASERVFRNCVSDEWSLSYSYRCDRRRCSAGLSRR